jgi:hypothetical protein
MNHGMNHGLNLDGGIHEIPMPTLTGRLWLCGKHFIGPDPERVLLGVNANHVVCLVHERELRDRYDGYISWLQSTDRATWYPIFDLSSPPLAEILPLYQGVVERLNSGESVSFIARPGLDERERWQLRCANLQVCHSTRRLRMFASIGPALVPKLVVS